MECIIARLDPLTVDPLMLLGEASHGTHEFYRERAQITRRLIEEKDFTTVAVEADWPDAYTSIATYAASIAAGKKTYGQKGRRRVM